MKRRPQLPNWLLITGLALLAYALPAVHALAEWGGGGNR